MTRLLKQAIEAVSRLSAAEQDEIAQMLLEIVRDGDDGDVYVLSDEERAALEHSLEFADRGEFATDDEVQAVFAKYRL